VRDGDTLAVPMLVTDAETIKDIKIGGKTELSAGYAADITIAPGVHPTYGQYDARMRAIVGNHISITASGRGGAQVRIGDTSIGDHNMDEKQAEALRKEVQDSKVALGVAEATLARTEAERDVLKADLAKAKAAEPTATVLDSMVAERCAVVDAARRLYPEITVAGKSLDAIRREAVQHGAPEIVLDGKSADYVAAVLDIQARSLVTDAEIKTATIGTFVGDSSRAPVRTSEMARAEMIAKRSGRI
jgi:hypothetical protein